MALPRPVYLVAKLGQRCLKEGKYHLLKFYYFSCDVAEGRPRGVVDLQARRRETKNRLGIRNAPEAAVFRTRPKQR